VNQKCCVSQTERDVRLTASFHAKARNDDHKADKTLVVRSESTSIRIVSQQTVGLECGNGKCAAVIMSLHQDDRRVMQPKLCPVSIGCEMNYERQVSESRCV
jgi:hypothetical protein